MSKVTLNPDYLFEVSWEVCNKVGGIHTVVSTKALTVTKKMGDNYILIGPDFNSDVENLEFAEDRSLLTHLRHKLHAAGIRARVGRWRIAGEPIVVLVDFTYLFSKKDEVLSKMWERAHVDSLSGEWDYVESILFGWAAGQVIATYKQIYCDNSDKIVAHFHEWMTVSGGIYLSEAAPHVATTFTTHATVLGRSIAGNHLPLYGNLHNYNPDELSSRFNVRAKHSIEREAAHSVDAFLTVSTITAEECSALLQRPVDCVTPNGFESDFVWKSREFNAKRKIAREKMISVAEALYGYKYKTEPIIIGTSGRYEYRNKGIDLFLESLKYLAADPNLDREILVYLTVPAGQRGPRVDLQARLKDPAAQIDPYQPKFLTHYMEHPEWDPVSNSIRGSILENTSTKVKVVFVPAYLNETDGIFGCPYYEVLVGMDATVYASYYEPWGYTPLESAAFHVPTITTTLSGFGKWVNDEASAEGVTVIERDDHNDGDVINDIAASILSFTKKSADEHKSLRKSVVEVANTALWSNLFSEYETAYDIALKNSISRTKDLPREESTNGIEIINYSNQTLMNNHPNWTRMMVETSLPSRLHALEKLSRNLWWCWTASARDLFESIDPALWVEVERNPIALIDRLSLDKLKALESDEVFLAQLDSVYADFTAYMAEKPEADKSTIAYFSMEYGLHSSLKIYSGGLGILAGDYLKEASDRNTPMVAVGLLYRYGYFTQRLSSQGAQEATYEAQNFTKLPISPVRDAEGNWVTVSVGLPGRTLTAHVWKCPVGRTDLYLMDTDHDLNLDEDKSITHHLYGGDWENRLKQEILLGIGGIRLLKALGIEQQVYHCNEGHAAFIGVERMRQLIADKGLTYAEAIEVVRSSALFTTHTPVPAGHDAFPESMIRQYMSHYPDTLGIDWGQYISLGKTNPADSNERFSMSVLACNLSQEVNGVSWLHGEVSKDIMGHMWPGYFKDELHIGYVTNGVHFPTWVAANLRGLYEKYFPQGFEGHTYQIPEWQGVHNIPDDTLWTERMKLKRRLFDHIRSRYSDPSKVRFDSPSQIVRIIDSLNPEVLTIGFARRFATYKRAHLLFTNLERLEAIVNNKEKPVQFVFAGKAHPNDKPGQDLIKRIVEVSLMPQFVGKILFLQNYDMELARHMVQGVDVWLNTPTRPLEASGTSGEKCVMNGVMQFSVLDGWWVEGYKPNAGWMLPMERTFADQRFQDELDAEMVYSTIEESIAPLYYSRQGFDKVPHAWLAYVKNCVADVASNFTTNRMLIDYEDRFYNKLAARQQMVNADGFAVAKQIAAWKSNILEKWNDIKVVDVQRARLDNEAIYVGKNYHYEVALDLAGLDATDVGVEMVVAAQNVDGQPVKVIEKVQLAVVKSEGEFVTYAIDYVPANTGMYDVAIRVYPTSDKLEYRMDMPLVKWA
ncbi:MAG: alpha-glucan family phosphorylase [Rikenellaceae bacterium]